MIATTAEDHSRRYRLGSVTQFVADNNNKVVVMLVVFGVNPSLPSKKANCLFRTHAKRSNEPMCRLLAVDTCKRFHGKAVAHGLSHPGNLASKRKLIDRQNRAAD